MSGLRAAIAYGLAPNKLGYCGPQKKHDRTVLLRYLTGTGTRRDTLPTAKRFEGAVYYYKLIARKNGIRDPFDEKVVRAYWVGNDMLEKVSSNDLKKMAIRNFVSPGKLTKAEALKRISRIPLGARPHHSFHVFIFGTITGVIDLNTVRLKDICRVSWGKIKEIGDKKVIVEYRPIVLKNKKLKLGKLERKEIRWDKKIVPKLKKGDRVSFHWGNLSEILTKEDVYYLKKYTLNTLKEL